MIPYGKERRKEKVIPRIIINIKVMEEWIKECEENIIKQERMIELIKQEIQNEKENINIYELGIMQMKMSILKLEKYND